MSKKSKWIYTFSEEGSCGSAGMAEILGVKGANLAQMCLLHLPVPPGFTISTDVCNVYYANERKLSKEYIEAIKASLSFIESKSSRVFGDVNNPLLLSVRSGAAVSMPGMMDTILNLGLNEETTEGLGRKTGNRRFALDSRRRFIQMYSTVVEGIRGDRFEEILNRVKLEKGILVDGELGEEELEEIIEEYLSLVEETTGASFEEDVLQQLLGAIGAVFDSWMSDRAKQYRLLHKISSTTKTSVTVQAMVFGNLGKTSATGVAFSRNPSTGEKELYGEFLVNAQGEDIVSGARTPMSLQAKEGGALSLEVMMPSSYEALQKICSILEFYYKDMQDMEFTIEEGKLWMLQTREGKRTIGSALQSALDMVSEGLITKEEALLRLPAEQLGHLFHHQVSGEEERMVVGRGLPASPGAARGRIVFSALRAMEASKEGEEVILFRSETSPEDIGGMAAACGIVTSCGGMTSHAAVVARGMGKPCIVGASDISIDVERKKVITARGDVLEEGAFVTIDSQRGEIMLGLLKMETPSLPLAYDKIMSWADEVRVLGLRANADTPQDTELALSLGAEGIGLCRTEHMFFASDRLRLIRMCIFSSSEEVRQKALDTLLPLQKQDFIEIFSCLGGLPATIRLLDPPLHEFLPQKEEDFALLAQELELSLGDVQNRYRILKETNPMLGHRGCRLGISYPSIYRMQSEAILGAAAVVQKQGIKVNPEVMIPLVITAEELRILRDMIMECAKRIEKQEGIKLCFAIGTMIETPRAALLADEIAQYAEFFSFGTNDLTQTTLGLSRDDAHFLADYTQQEILKEDPFSTLDTAGVGQLIKIAMKKGLEARKGLKIGICGEHGGDPRSIRFFHCEKMDYISCSSYRLPIARLAAAQAVLKDS